MFTGILKKVVPAAGTTRKSVLLIVRRIGVTVSITVDRPASENRIAADTPVLFDPLSKTVTPMQADL